MIRAMRESAGSALAILGLVMLAGAVASYILSHQRFRFPFTESPVEYRAELSTAQAVAPGQGQTVRVSGVKVGDIGQVELREGRAIVTLEIDPDYTDIIRTDATALLRPKTGLKDMFLELDPGSKRAPRAEPGFTIPVQNTLPDVNVDEVLSALDSDTRDYVQLLVNGAGKGLDGRGDQLAEVYRRFEPTHRHLAGVTRRVAQRRRLLRRLVRSLGELSTELGRKDDELAQLVSSSSAVFRTFASEQANLSETIRLLPAALRQTRASLADVNDLSVVLGPAAERLRPAARQLEPTTAALRALAREATEPIRTELRPFVREARPLVRDLRPSAAGLDEAGPWATRTVKVTNRLFNMGAYNEEGREPAGDPARDEGYLFWLAWLSHNGAAIFSTGDAHGPFRPVVQDANCSTWAAMATELGRGNPLAGIALRGLEGVFTDERLCGSPQSTSPAFRKRLRAKDKGEER